MSQHLQHARLEQAISRKQPLTELTQQPHPVLKNYCVSDYVGNPSLKQDTSTDNTHAAGFFADQGAHRETLRFPKHSANPERAYNVAIFATFLVIEINAGTGQAEFLVLMPRRTPDQEGGLYVGLMRSHNTDDLHQALVQEPEKLEQLGREVDSLLAWLRSTPARPNQPTQKNWFSQLFNNKE